MNVRAQAGAELWTRLTRKHGRRVTGLQRMKRQEHDALAPLALELDSHQGQFRHQLSAVAAGFIGLEAPFGGLGVPALAFLLASGYHIDL